MFIYLFPNTAMCKVIYRFFVEEHIETAREAHLCVGNLERNLFNPYTHKIKPITIMLGGLWFRIFSVSGALFFILDKFSKWKSNFISLVPLLS